MAAAKFPTLADSGYPDDYDLFNRHMQAMCESAVPKSRRALLKKFGQYIGGEVADFENVPPDAKRRG